MSNAHLVLVKKCLNQSLFCKYSKHCFKNFRLHRPENLMLWNNTNFYCCAAFEQRMTTRCNMSTGVMIGRWAQNVQVCQVLTFYSVPLKSLPNVQNVQNT